MRRVRWSPGKDFFVALIGAVLLLGATAGIFYLDQRPTGQLEVGWREATSFGDELDGSMEEGGEPVRHSFVLDEETIYERLVLDRMIFALEWDEPSTDTFRLTVTAPNGTVETRESDTGRLEMDLEIQSAHGIIRSHKDKTAQEVWGEIAPEVRAAGRGEWDLKVELLEAPRDLVEGVEDPTQPKENGFHLEILARGWYPVTMGHPSLELR